MLLGLQRIAAAVLLSQTNDTDIEIIYVFTVLSYHNSYYCLITLCYFFCQSADPKLGQQLFGWIPVFVYTHGPTQ